MNKISGIVKSVDQQSIVIAIGEKQYRCYYSEYMWICPGDQITVTVKPCQAKTPIKSRDYKINVEAIAKPFVRPPTDKQQIVSLFIKATRDIIPNQEKLYLKFADRMGRIASNTSPEDIVSYISTISELYAREGRSDILQPMLMPDPAAQLPAIKAKTLKTILIWWFKNYLLRSLYMLGLTDRNISASHTQFADLYWKCLNCPWTLVSLSRQQVEQLVITIGHHSEPQDIRCYEIVKSIYDNMTYNGWTSLSIDYLVYRFPDIEPYFSRIFTKFDVVYNQGYFYMNYVAPSETIVINKLRQYINKSSDLGVAQFRTTRLELTEEQKSAVQGAMSYPICIITGGAGTGKTTMVEEILYNYEIKGLKYVLCSPTGRAASKLKITTDSEIAYTVHRLISNATSSSLAEKIPDRLLDEELITRGQDVRDTDVIIFDEASMLTTKLLSDLFRVLKHNYRIVLIGDVNQLRPVEWGSIFDVMIDSGKFPVYRLTKTIRQTNTNDGIVPNCNKILSSDDWHLTPTSNFILIDGTIDDVKKIIKSEFDNQTESKDLKVITPMKADQKIINVFYSDIYDNGYPSITDSNGTRWRLYDHVMLTKNNYNIEIFNGEEGQIINIDEQGETMTVKFYNEQENKVYINSESVDKTDKEILTIDQLSHAGCLTVHQAQGGEWQKAIFYYPKMDKIPSFCDRKLIYTALSRSRDKIWCVGQIDQLEQAAKRPTPIRKDAFTYAMSNLSAGNDD